MNRPNKQFSFEVNPIGRGLIVKKFPEAFKWLLTSGYNEGTPFGFFYNGITNENQSMVYVAQPCIEQTLTDVVAADTDSLKYLVGFTGIGKTTLLKNFFRTLSRDVVICEKKIIIYVSFQSSNISSGTGESINHITEYMKLAIRRLCEKYSSLADLVSSDGFASILAEYIRNNKPSILEIDDMLPNSAGKIDFSFDIDRLEGLHRKNPSAYYSLLLKFLLKRCAEIERLILVFDDIESQSPRVQKEIITHANHIHNCCITEHERFCRVKIIISLKNFTFREHIDREISSRRFLIENDVILKEEIPELGDIFKKRFSYAKTLDMRKVKVENLPDWEEAVKILEILCNDLSLKFGKMICRLTNNNIVESFDSFIRILTNNRYVAAYEVKNEGAFKIQKENYNITSAETILKALALGENEVYVQHEQSLFCNILSVHEEEMSGCELLGLYIIKYFKTAFGRGMNTIYGTKFERGTEIVDRIASLFEHQGEQYTSDFKERLNYIISFLYTGRVLLRSIYDYEDPNQAITQLNRQYNSDFGLYLSWKGMELFDQLSNSSILFELFRDDIDTELYNCDLQSSKMTTTERLLYLIEYTNILFEQVETQYIRKASRRLKTYCTYFGNTFITCVLLEGIARSTSRFYKIRDHEYQKIKTRIIELINRMNSYSKLLEDETGICISITEYLKHQL